MTEERVILVIVLMSLALSTILVAYIFLTESWRIENSEVNYGSPHAWIFHAIFIWIIVFVLSAGLPSALYILIRSQ